MLIDYFIGLIGLIVGLFLGFGWNSLIVLFSAFVLDSDIVVNELYRIFIKREKKFSAQTFLDEYSYTHKFIFHLPLVMIPAAYFLGSLYLGTNFGLLILFMISGHLIHDTLDKNFDGVSWLWPFLSASFKIRHGSLVIKSRARLRKEAEIMAKHGRNTREILQSNQF